MTRHIRRRDFLKNSAALGASLAGVPAVHAAKPGPEPIRDKVRIGIIGVGGRGNSLMGNLLIMKDVEVRAIGDIYSERAKAAQQRVVKAGMAQPDIYAGDEQIWKKLVDRDDLDAIIIASYWKWHTPMAVYAMRAGKYAGTEVPAARTVAECWELVDTSEKTGVPCMMLENWSFRRDNLAVLNMIRRGLFGEIVHCHCAHSHDCFDHWFFDRQTGKDRWPAKYLLNSNRDQYPTHQVGPVLSWMDIGCGDAFDYLTATATNCFGINDMFVRRFGPDHPGSQRTYAQGDIVTTTVRTKNGKSLVINYDMQLPRPYDNRWMIQGTRGIYNEQRDAVYFVDKSPEYHKWEPFGPYQTEYENAWWKKYSGQGGHGGTDFIELRLFVDAVKHQTQTPLTVYDGVVMSVIGALSEKSIGQRSAPVDVPDFTRGKWKTTKPRFGLVT